MAAIEPSFDFGASPGQASTDLCAGHAPALAVPFHRVVRRDRAHHAHAENLLQPMRAFQASMCIACRPWTITGVEPKLNEMAVVPGM